MSITLNVCNGFKIEEVRREGERLDLSITYLIDGEAFTKEEHVNISPKEKERLIVKCIAMSMRNLEIGIGETAEEKERMAKKAMNLNAINDYMIIRKNADDETESQEITIELLKNGEFFTSTKLKGSEDNIVGIKRKLRNIKIENLNVKNQIRPIYLSEILAIIE